MPGAVACIAASLDGFIATPDGGAAWLAGVTTLAMGRATNGERARLRGLSAEDLPEAAARLAASAPPACVVGACRSRPARGRGRHRNSRRRAAGRTARCGCATG